MGVFFALLLSGLIVAIPTIIIFYIFSYVIFELFGGEIYVVILFAIAMFFVLAEVFKVYKRVKDWNS